MATLEEIQAELSALGVSSTPTTAKTVPELAEEWGCTEVRVRKLLRKGIESGLVTATRKLVPRISGGVMTVPAYEITLTKRKPRKAVRRK